MRDTYVDPLNRPLRAVIRFVPALDPADSQGRFVQLVRHQPVTILPVQQHGILCGVVALDDLLPLLACLESVDREGALLRPVSEIMRQPEAVATPDMTPRDVAALCARYNVNLVPVVDSENYALGMVLATDLLQPDLPPPCPGSIGGMATPFGVYLTNGSIQAGVGNVALAAAGVQIGMMLSLSYAVVAASLWFVGQYAHIPHYENLILDYAPSAGHPVMGLVSIAMRLFFLGVFLMLMRLTRLAGYHAAEHQAVHALERHEPLAPSIVQRMPRAHPRCGTNLMAAGTLFFTMMQLFQCVPYLDIGAPLFAALTTLMTWRTVGVFLQERFTTRPASPREIESGIVAGTDLVNQYINSRPDRPGLWRRIWCMGLIQTTLGISLVVMCLQLVLSCMDKLPR